MFIEYNKQYYPFIIIKFNGSIKNDKEFYEFTNYWLELNDQNKNFVFIFDTFNIGLINIKYCFLMALFIKKLKKQKNNYLQFSLILINNKFIKSLFDLIFLIEKPIANVYISNNSINDIINLNEKIFIKNKNINHNKNSNYEIDKSILNNISISKIFYK